MSDKTKYLISLLMAFNVLIASLGINLYRHTCNALQTSMVSAEATQKSCCCTGGTNESACAMPAHQSESKGNEDNKKPNPDDCCQDEVQLFQTDVFSAKFELKNEFTSFAVALPQLYCVDIVPVFVKEQVISFSDSSPPVSGKHRIILHQSFLL